MNVDVQQLIKQGETSLGIEFGSTRIKAVLLDRANTPLASGGFEWENQLVDGVWTYSLELIWKGLQEAYAKVKVDVNERYQVELTKIGSIGISAMMHGYLAFDKHDTLLVPFRTWRNAMTAQAEEELTEAFAFTIPQRWSIAHLYQAHLNKEQHLADLSFMTTLAGYIHWQLTGEKVLGVGDASGMFPIDSATKTYDQAKVATFEKIVSAKEHPWELADVLPRVLVAGEEAGRLTKEGALRLDPTGSLAAGSVFCPPEGDAGTGMVATNSVAPRTGNVSIGTSAFAMIVLEQPLPTVHPEIDMVTTPTGSLVAMVHTNNCSSDINAWMHLFRSFADLAGMTLSTDELFGLLFNEALKGDADAGGLLSYGYYSGENITKIAAGRPIFARTPESQFTLANFMRTHLYSAFGAMKIGLAILESEDVAIDRVVGHGGLFRTPVVGQRILAAAMNAPVTVMETAGEGGAWGIAVLANYLQHATQKDLATYLDEEVFAMQKSTTIDPVAEDVAGFATFVARYQKGLPIEQAAVDTMRGE